MLQRKQHSNPKFTEPHNDISKKNTSKNTSTTFHNTLALYNRIIIGCSFAFLMCFNYVLLTRMIQPRFWYISASCTFILPALMLMLSYYHHREYNTLTKEEELAALEKEIESETEILSTIPVLLFGLGIIYTQYKKADYTTHTLAFLLMAILFGSLFPQLAKHLVFDHNNLTRMFVIEEIIFSFIAIAFGLIIASMVLPLYMQFYAIKG